jgi:hypothetical protein
MAGRRPAVNRRGAIAGRRLVAACRFLSYTCLPQGKEKYMAKKKPVAKSVKKPAAKPKPAKKKAAKKPVVKKAFALVEAHSAHLAELMESLFDPTREMTLADVRREMEAMLSGLDELDEQFGREHALCELR